MRVLRNTEHKIPTFESYSKVWKSVRNSTFRIAVTTIGAAASVLVANILVAGQATNKTVSFRPAKTFMAPQVAVKEVRVGDDLRKIKITRARDAFLIAAENFMAEPNWLTRTSFQIENVSGKPIVYLSLTFLFPETTATGNIMAYTFSLGRRPGSTSSTSNPSFLMMPKETMDFSLASRYSDISRFVGERHAIETLNEITFEIGFIVFEDGTAWTAGQFMRQDPKNPNHYVPIQTDPGN